MATPEDVDFTRIDEMYDECIQYLKSINEHEENNVKNPENPNNTQQVIENEFTENGRVVNHKQDNDSVSNEKNKEEFYIENEIIKNNQTVKLPKTEENTDLYDNTMIENDTTVTKDIKSNIYEEVSEKKLLREKDLDPTNGNDLGDLELNDLGPPKSERLRKLSQQLPRIIITQSCNSIDEKQYENGYDYRKSSDVYRKLQPKVVNGYSRDHHRYHRGYGSDYPKRLVSKNGLENVALISNVPFEKIRLLNDTFHTLINLRWRWIVSGTIVLHFAIWLVFAIFWYITALAHYDFEPDPPKRACVTGGKDFVTIFLASVEAQTTIGFGDRAIDEECPESIFLFVMQLILGTGLSGVLTCVVYAKLTRPEKLSRYGVGFSKKAVISLRDGKLCLMIRAWDLNYDHIISSEFTAHFVKTHRTKEGETIRYYARSLALQQRQFLLWPVTLVHEVDATSPLYHMTPQDMSESNYEITVSLKGASASMGTFTQSQTSYLPREIVWGYRFPSVIRYDRRKQKYVVEHDKLNAIERVDTPYCSAKQFYKSSQDKLDTSSNCPGTPSSFSEKLSTFHLERTTSFRKSKV